MKSSGSNSNWIGRWIFDLFDEIGNDYEQNIKIIRIRIEGEDNEYPTTLRGVHSQYVELYNSN